MSTEQLAAACIFPSFPGTDVPDWVRRFLAGGGGGIVLFAYILLNNAQKQTLTIWLASFLGTSRGTDWGGLMAGATLTAIPVVIFFLLVQRRIAFGLTAGAVRG